MFRYCRTLVPAADRSRRSPAASVGAGAAKSTNRNSTGYAATAADALGVVVVDVLNGFVPSSTGLCERQRVSNATRQRVSCVLSMAGAQRERLRLCDPALSCGKELDQWARLGVLAMTCKCRLSRGERCAGGSDWGVCVRD